EYEQKFMPEGRFIVDGFLCVFDVSDVPNRSVDKQVDICASILTTVLRMKKPIILVATKCDEAAETYVREIEKLVNRKEFKGLVPVVECSSHENINETLDMATDAFSRLLKLQVTDYGSMWSSTAKKLTGHQEYIHYVDIFGKDNAQRLFKHHIRKLKDDYLGAKIQRYLDLLPEVLHELFPDFDNMGEG
ncbi:Uncharacterized protein FKW44_016252, partial [Caligus rogercresseyi]